MRQSEREGDGGSSAIMRNCKFVNFSIYIVNLLHYREGRRVADGSYFGYVHNTLDLLVHESKSSSQALYTTCRTFIVHRCIMLSLFHWLDLFRCQKQYFLPIEGKKKRKQIENEKPKSPLCKPKHRLNEVAKI